MGCFLPHKRQPIVDFYKSYAAPEIAYIDVKNPIDEQSCEATWDCRYASFFKRTGPAKSVILDTETYNCVHLTVPGDWWGLQAAGSWFDGINLFIVGIATSAYYGYIAKFNVDLDLVDYKCLNCNSTTICEFNGLLYVAKHSRGYYTITKDLVLSSPDKYIANDSFYNGRLANQEVLIGRKSGGIYSTDGTLLNVGGHFLIGTNDICATKDLFIADKQSYYQTTHNNTYYGYSWAFSPSHQHMCGGSYVVRVDPNNDFAVIKALYAADYDFFGCTDDKFLAIFKPTNNVAIINTPAGIDGLAQLEGFSEVSFSITKQSANWVSFSPSNDTTTEVSLTLDASDGNCVEVTL